MLKIVFIGDESVGKTSIINNCINSTYKLEYTPTDGIYFFDRNYPNKSCNCTICDTPGQPQLRSMIPTHLHSCNTCVILYDITRRQSFLNLDQWLDFVTESNNNIPVIIIAGNKNDLESQREVSTDEAEEYAKSHNLHFIETSVKEESDFLERVIDISLPKLEAIQNSPEYIKEILQESKKSLEKSKNELKKIKNLLKERPEENLHSLFEVISLLENTKNSLEDRKQSIEKSAKPSKESIQSLERSINSIQKTINSLEDSKVVIQKTIEKSKTNLEEKEEVQKELSQAEKVLSQVERKITQEEEELEQKKKELIQDEEEEEEEENENENEKQQKNEEEEEVDVDVVDENEEDLVHEEEEEKLLLKAEKELEEIELSLDENELSQEEENKSSYEKKKDLEEKINLYTRTLKILKTTKDSSPEMNLLITNIKTKLREKKEQYLDYLPQIRCLMLGLDSSGKTTILYKLKRNKLIKTNSTTGFNVEPVLYNEIIYYLWDIGGQNHIRSSWKYYYKDTNVLIFVVDSSDLQRIEEARKELNNLLNEEELEESILLILDNKQDLPNAIKPNDLINLLQLNNVTDRNWIVFGTSSVSDEGLHDALNWISETLNLKKVSDEPKQKVSNKLPKSVKNKLKEVISALEDKENSVENKIRLLRRFIRALEHKVKSLSESPSKSSQNNFSENIQVLIDFFKKIFFVFQNKNSSS